MFPFSSFSGLTTSKQFLPVLGTVIDYDSSPGVRQNKVNIIDPAQRDRLKGFALLTQCQQVCGDWYLRLQSASVGEKLPCRLWTVNCPEYQNAEVECVWQGCRGAPEPSPEPSCSFQLCPVWPSAERCRYKTEWNWANKSLSIWRKWTVHFLENKTVRFH